MVNLSPVRQRLLDHRAGGLQDHRARFGALPDRAPSDIRAAARNAGLTGRGGAAFPLGRKLDAVAASGRPAVVIGNGAEGEPASIKDRVLLSSAPHLVLDGLAAAARAVGARQTYLYVPERVHAVVADAIRERGDAVDIVTVSGGFVAGQESAVVAAVSGRRPLPFETSTPVYERGVAGRPTLVSNVETLAHLALLVRYGPDWFRSVGAPEEPGSRLVSVAGAAASPVVHEVPTDITLGQVLDLVGQRAHAALVGGYHGTWVPVTDLARSVPMTASGLAPFGARPGAGVVLTLEAGHCGVATTAGIVDYLARESSGQCGPCTNGLPALATAMAALAAGSAVTDHELMRLAGLVSGRGACHHPDATARMIASAMRVFETDIAAHRRGGCVHRRERAA
jgi:NADH:ubiquinone oxidoreductase subunit F (NADH-binding)